MSIDTLDCPSKGPLTSFRGNLVLLNGNRVTHIDVGFQLHFNDMCLCRLIDSPAISQPIVGPQPHWIVSCRCPAVSSKVGAIFHATVAQIALSAQIGAMPQ